MKTKEGRQSRFAEAQKTAIGSFDRRLSPSGKVETGWSQGTRAIAAALASRCDSCPVLVVRHAWEA